MGKDKSRQGRVIDDAFRREAVRLLSTSGRTAEQVADDLGIGRSTLTKWKSKLAEVELMAGPHDDVHMELVRLRRENELPRAERDLQKKRPPSLARRRSRLRQHETSR